jgi:pantoate--beta-alanine ligase
MGYLHEGHLTLVDGARAENDVVVMSIFVNPTQFGPAEDYGRYPRNLERDRALAAERGVDVLFTPDVGTMYPNGPEAQRIWVDPGSMADTLCGASRPGHFRGVATVVAKLFATVEPDRAYFGQKDAQQAAIIRAMARDLAYPIEVRVVPTVREPDGLALSSRNVYLSPLERAEAVALIHALSAARDAIAAGEIDAGQIERLMCDTLAREAPHGRVDYVAVADPHTLQLVDGIIRAEVLLALAVYFGKTRLIDNVTARPPAVPEGVS